MCLMTALTSKRADTSGEQRRSRAARGPAERILDGCGLEGPGAPRMGVVGRFAAGVMVSGPGESGCVLCNTAPANYGNEKFFSPIPDGDRVADLWPWSYSAGDGFAREAI